MRKVSNGGGWAAIRYTLTKAREVGGYWKLWKALRTKNTCKTCALGMGGQAGGMVNERGSFPEVCKKSIQAMASDMQPAITADFWDRNSIDELRTWSPLQLEKSGRLIQPILYEQGASHYRTITWKEAFERIVGQLKEISAEESFWYFSGRSSNEAGFLMQLLARQYGTNNVNNCSYYCHQASGVGLQKALGTGTATVTLDDLERSDLAIIIGGNPASNHPRLMTSLLHLRRRGGKVIVINPVNELGMRRFRIPSDWKSMLMQSDIASHVYQPHIGGDLAMLTGVAKHLVASEMISIDFVDNYCNGFNDYKQWLSDLSWEELATKSGVSQREMCELAEVYAGSKSTIFGWTMGITHHQHGVDNVNSIVNLSLLRGMVGRPGAGLMPIRGHSNVQGIGSVGVTPQLKKQIFDSLTNDFGLKLPTTAGLDTMACVEAAEQGRLKAGVCLGGNLFGSNPDADYAKRALENLDMMVTLSTTLNTGHAHGLAKQSITLPVLARDEEPQATTQESMFNFVRLSDGGKSRVPGPRSEVSVVSEIAQRLLTEQTTVDWKELEDTAKIRDWIAKVIPGYEAIGEIDQTKKEFQITGRTFHEPRFATEDGKANFFSFELPELVSEAGREFRLMTVRSEGQFNTVVYEVEDLYRGQERRDLVLMHPEDMNRLDLAADQRVKVESAAGQLGPVLARSYEAIKPGNVLMYFPEANVLVPRNLDPQSRTPAFKAVAVSIQPCA